MITEFRIDSALPAVDLDRARRFYADKVGLEPTREGPEGLWYELAEGTGFLLFPSPVSERAGHTQAGIVVTDIDSVLADLRGRGVVFEEYDSPGFKTEGGIFQDPGGGRSAWFKDSEGNMLAIVQPPTA